MSKTKIIQEYLEKNPSHTWKDAREELEPKGITGSYFAMQKSKLKKPESKAESKIEYVDQDDEVEQCKEFVRSVGGIDKAIELLMTLKRWQI